MHNINNQHNNKCPININNSQANKYILTNNLKICLIINININRMFTFLLNNNNNTSLMDGEIEFILIYEHILTVMIIY